MRNKMMHEPVKVLQVTIGDGSYGGVASFMFSYYSHMNHENVHFDFLYCGENSMQSKISSPVLKNSNITTFHIMKPRNNGVREYWKLLKKLKPFFGKNQYDIVHINTSNILVCACVIHSVNKKAICITHSHSAFTQYEKEKKFKNKLKNLIKGVGRQYILKNSDYHFACSKVAGIKLYGENELHSSKFKLIKNAIDLSAYRYNPNVRQRIRKTENLVVGYVGRLATEKNLFFLIEIFSEIYKINSNSELWVIGEGNLLEDLQAKVKEMGLIKNVIFWGRRTDVADLMQAMDIFMLPSIYEGLSIVAVEAQAAGLPVYASDSISEEHRITSLVQFLPLSYGGKKWAEKILDDLTNLPKRKDMTSEMVKSGYEISQASIQLEEFYLSIKK